MMKWPGNWRHVYIYSAVHNDGQLWPGHGSRPGLRGWLNAHHSTVSLAPSHLCYGRIAQHCKSFGACKAGATMAKGLDVPEMLPSRLTWEEVKVEQRPRGGLVKPLNMLCRSFDFASLRNELRSLVDEEMLTSSPSQSRLSQEQLTQLQKDTHFDKKELQQWYKGPSHVY